MTLDELDEELRDRGAALSVSYLPDGVSVSMSHQRWLGSKLISGKSAAARADKLGDAVDLALRRYDARW